MQEQCGPCTLTTDHCSPTRFATTDFPMLDHLKCMASTQTAKKVPEADYVLQNAVWSGGGPNHTYFTLTFYPWSQSVFCCPLLPELNFYTIYYYSVELSTQLTGLPR